MKKIFKSFSISIIMILALVLISACDNENEHAHSFTIDKSDENKHWKECSCGERSGEEEHTFGDWKITKEATETEKGAKEKECDICHRKETEDIPVLPHSHQFSSDWTIDKEPTCTEEGSKSHHCLGCSEKIDITTIEMKDHTYGEWITTKEATEETEGFKERKCGVCHHKETETVPIIESLKYQLNEDGKSYSVVGIGTIKDSNLIIPEEYNGLPVTSIGNNAFEDCSDLISITIPTSVTSIGDLAFYECKSLTSIIIPTSVTSIGNNAFFTCYRLVEIYNLSSINITLGSSDNGCIGYYAKGIHTSLEESNLITKDDYVFYKDNNNKYYLVGYNGTATDLVLPNDIEGNTYEINRYAFFNCNLTSVIISNSVTSIGSFAFYGCSSLTSVTIGKSVTSIGEYSFSYCSSLTNIEIPVGVTSIENGVFSGCSSLTNIVIPNSVTSIGSAFSYCSSLNVVYFTGTPTEWSNITIASDNSYLTSATFYFYKDENGYEPHLHTYQITFDIENHWQECACGVEKEVEKHTYGDWITTKEPTETAEGTKERECSVCQHKESDTIPVLSHTHQFSTEWAIDKEATCTTTGSKSHHCLGCSEKTDITTIEMKAHTFGEWITTNEPTETKEGTKERECSVCQHKESETLPIIESLTYQLNEDGKSYSVVGIGTIKDSNIIIPNEYKGLPVTKIGRSAFDECGSLTSITIPNSVTSIGENAFYECRSKRNVYYEGTIEDWCNISFNTLFSNPMYIASHFYLKNSNNEWEEVTSIEIPNTITEIGAYQFTGFNNITSITIPNSVTNIGACAFLGCFKLVEVYNLSSLNIIKGSEDNGYVGYYAKVIHTSLEESNFIVKDDYLFIKDNENKYYLVGYIGNSIDLVLPTDVVGNTYEISTGSFYKCDNITSIVIPDGVIRIGDSAFENCSSLTSISIPNSIEYIGASAFNGCKNLQYKTYDNGYYLGNNANPYIVFIRVLSKDISTCQINDNTKVIYETAFQNCKNLASITIPNGVISIGKNAFQACMALTSIEIPNSITSIGERAFHVCINLTSVVLPNSITNIGEAAFSRCINLSSVEIPNSVTTIEYLAFDGCSSLISITIPAGITSIDDFAFYQCYSLVEVYNLSSLMIIKGSKDNGYIGYYAKEIHTSLEEESNLITKDDYVFYRDNNKYYLVGYNGIETKLVLPNDIKGNAYEINTGAFYNCSNITSITIPDSVTSIGDSAFNGCNSLTSVTIGNSVTSIGEYAFYNCSLTNIEIPVGVTSIENGVFSGCGNLTSIVIPNSVTSIGSAFSYCSSFNEVYFTGTSTEWSSISMDSNLTSVTIYYYSETQPTDAGNYWHHVDGVVTKW